ncbi:MAG: hypothetical protein N2322_00275 [Terrimicrobiaceae bacterium]|nr:hypothetical protein [Terrimicrobiaceae bacterium]
MVELFLATESISAHLEFFRNLRYQSTGMLIVMLSLGFLAVVVAVVARLLEPTARPGVAPSRSPVAGPAAEIPPEIQAAIAAAVLVTLKSPHRIHVVRPPANPNLSAWSAEGRRQIFQSHTFRR